MKSQTLSTCREVAMLDLAAEHDRYRDELRDAALRVIESNRFIGGPDIAALETELAGRVGVGDCIAVSSGTDALLAAMMALDIGAGDEVIVPPLTFFATAGVVARLGATPVFVDIDPRTFNIDPDRVASAITERTRAIVAVDLFGQCAEMDTINAIARERSIRVIEDAAQALGASYHDRPAGSLGDIACVSFYPTKNLGGCGEGGAVFTAEAALAAVVRAVRNHGESQRYVHERVGGNFRLDSMKAAMLRVKLARFDEVTRRRRESARRYDELLDDVNVVTPYVGPGQAPVYHQYSILSDRRDELASFLRDRGVGSVVYYPVPLHLQPCFAALGYRPGSLPVAEETCKRIVSIPCHPMLDRADIDYVAGCIREFHRS
jgi:dTDP-4-amino-4,6-dideoxygalactose transaminase